MKRIPTYLLLLLAVILGTNVAKAEDVKYDYEFKASVLCQADWYGTRRSNGSHTIHNYYLVLGDKALDSDGNPSAGSTVYALDFFGAAPADEHNPNPAVGTYSFSSEIADNVLYSDIHVYQLDGNGNYELDRDFKAGKLVITTEEKDGNTYYTYDAVLTDDADRTHHVTYTSRFITYNDLSQGSIDLEKDLNFKCINASAKYKSVEDGVMQVSLEMADMEKFDDDYSYDNLPGRQMFIEAYLPMGKSLANGVYNVSEDSYGDAFTLENGELINYWGVQYAVGTYVQYVFGNKEVAWGCVKSGTLTVSGEGDHKKIEGDFLTDYGYSIKFTYEGELPIDGVPQTAFTSDVTLDLEGATAQFECIGDAERLNGCRNWYITLLPADGKDNGFISYINTAADSFFDGIASGTYTSSPSSVPWKFEYLKGSKNDNGQLRGTWALTGFDADGQPQVNAPVSDGDLNITKHDDGVTYTLDFNLDDGAGHKIKGTWTGEPELVNSCGDEPATGINGVTDNMSNEVNDIFTVSGSRTTSKVKGLNIVRYKDGSVRKQVVK